jgi:hypothetical protein
MSTTKTFLALTVEAVCLGLVPRAAMAYGGAWWLPVQLRGDACSSSARSWISE